MIVNEDFYREDAVTVAKNLIGKSLKRKINDQIIEVKIVETEAYMGAEDKASHAYNNKKTKRTEKMFVKGGTAYIYLIYGMYYCFNIVTESKEKPQAVLIRAVEPVSGLEIIENNRNIKSDKKEDLTNGPGKLCQALSINKSLNGVSLFNSEKLYIEKAENNNFEIGKGKRINIDYAEEYQKKPWRFYLEGSSFLS